VRADDPRGELQAAPPGRFARQPEQIDVGDGSRGQGRERKGPVAP
jgi:hypothetical protein